MSGLYSMENFHAMDQWMGQNSWGFHQSGGLDGANSDGKVKWTISDSDALRLKDAHTSRHFYLECSMRSMKKVCEKFSWDVRMVCM